jgi:hypothetical protein
LVQAIVKILEDNGLSPMWDRDFAYGQGFHDQIKNFIAHAHVFLPVLTHAANERNWVHQEIGFASALNIPVLPLAIGEMPGEMIYHLHAISVELDSDDRQSGSLKDGELERLKKLLTTDAIEQLVERGFERGGALYACAEFPEARAAMIAEYCEGVRALGRFGKVRQKGALTSFHLPPETINHRTWKERYGKSATEKCDEVASTVGCND